MHQSPTPPTSTLMLHVYYCDQRFTSAPILCSCDPDIDEGFLLQINKPNTRNLPLPDVLSLSDPIYLIMTLVSPQAEIELIGTHKLNWRTVLCCHGNKTVQSVELSGLKTDGQVPPGVLNLQWELLPKEDSCLSQEVLEVQVQLERQQANEKKRMFLLYAKQWWKEYLGIRQGHSQRLVKIFAEDEAGVSKVVCQYVSPLRVGRLLDGPRHAARFVSLLEHQQPACLGGRGGGGEGEMWRSLHSLLATKSGVS